MFICKICNEEFDKAVKLTTHIQYHHKNFTLKQYYDTYEKTDAEGQCKICGNPTVFEGLRGYKTYCSRKCAWQDPEVKKTRATTIAAKPESDIRAWRQKYIDTKIAKYGTKLSEADLTARKARSELHFKTYLDKCNCDFLSYENKKVTFKCRACNTKDSFVRSLIDRYDRENDFRICHVCNSRYSSKPERELFSYISSICQSDILQRNKSLIGKELDILIPEKHIAIEFDGLYWHNDTILSENAHLDKTIKCEAAGYQLIHIFEDEWRDKTEIVKSRLSGLLNHNTRIFARKTEVREVDASTAKIFLDTNHIQGSCSSKYKLGLYYQGELVSLMTFGSSRFAKSEFELIRFCNKLYTNVVGGASKLFKHFCKMHPEVKTIVSYADRRWSKGRLYETLGFKKAHVSIPSYFYIVNGVRENRIKYQKHKLVSAGFDANKTEREIMSERGIRRIYDCGTIKYVFDIL